MSYRFSNRSLERLVDVHPKLVDIAWDSLSQTPVDFGILHGLRDRQTQYDLYNDGKSKLNGIAKGHRGSVRRNREVIIIEGTGVSKHQRQPSGYSEAIDILAYPNGKLSWKAVDYLDVLEVFREVAERRQIVLRFGIGWFRSDKVGSVREGYEYAKKRGKWIDAYHIEYRGKK